MFNKFGYSLKPYLAEGNGMGNSRKLACPVVYSGKFVYKTKEQKNVKKKKKKRFKKTSASAWVECRMEQSSSNW